MTGSLHCVIYVVGELSTGFSAVHYHHSRLFFRRDDHLRTLQGLRVTVPSHLDLRAHLTHEVGRRLSYAVGQEHSASKLQGIGRTSRGEARLPT